MHDLLKYPNLSFQVSNKMFIRNDALYGYDFILKDTNYFNFIEWYPNQKYEVYYVGQGREEN